MGVHLMNVHFDLCDNVECPLKKGVKFQGVVEQVIPGSTPSGVEVTVDITLKDSDKRELTCLSTKVEIRKPNSYFEKAKVSYL